MSNFFDRLVSPGAQHHVPTEGSPDDDLQQEVDEVDITAEPRTAADVKRVAQELLKHGHLEESHKRELFRCAILTSAGFRTPHSRINASRTGGTSTLGECSSWQKLELQLDVYSR